MAKKVSIQDQIYQSIVNSQVQQAYKNMRDQDYQMAQNLISQYQPTQDDYTMAQNLIAQYQPAPQPTAQPVAEPVKQATVNEVKAKSTPKTTQQIPSIADYFRPKTASGKDINKEAAKFIGRESYARQQQEENMLASESAKRSKEETAKKIVENKTVDKFVPQANIPDQNNVNDYRKALLAGTDVNKGQPEVLSNKRTELDELADLFKDSMKKYTPFKRDAKLWTNPYESLSEDQKQLVRNYIEENKNNPNLTKEERENLKAFTQAYNKTGERQIDTTNADLYYSNDAERAIKSLSAGFNEFNKPIADALSKVVTKLPILNQIDVNQANEDVSNRINAAKALNPGAAETGRSFGQMYDYAVSAPFINALGGVANLGKAGTIALNQALQASQDVGLDIAPEAQRMLREEDKIDWGELAKRFGTDITQNAVMEAIPFLGAANYDSLVKTVGNNADIFKNIEASGALKNVPDVLRSANDAVEKTGKVPFIQDAIDNSGRSLTEIAKTPTDDLSIAHRQVDRGLEGLEKFRTIKENDAVSALNKDGKIDTVLAKNPSIKRVSTSIRKPESLLTDEETILADQIARYSGWDMKTNELFDYGITPEILKEHGIKGRKIMMTQRTFDKISLPGKYPIYKDELNKVGKHGFDKSGAMKLIRALDDPAIIYKANADGDIGVVVNLSDLKGNPVLVPLTIGKDGLIENVGDIAGASKIKSAHIRHGLGNYLEKHPEDVYYIKGDAESLSKGIWNSPLDSTSPNLNIEDTASDVNKNTINNNEIKLVDPEVKNLVSDKEPEAPKKNYSIEEVNLKNGKTGYYVAETLDDGTVRNVEPGKVYRKIDDANEAAYKLQFFGEGDGKDKWKTSKFYTNTSEKKGWQDNLDKRDYEYRATNAEEQLDYFNRKFKDSKDIVRDLVELDHFNDGDMRGAMKTMEDLMEGSIDDIRKANRLGNKISFEGREGGRVVQAMYDAKANTPTGQVRQAQQKIGEAIDKRVGKGTSEALDNLYEKVAQAYDKAKNKEEFAKKLEELLKGDLKKYASKKTAIDMDSKQIRGLNKIIKKLDKAESLDDVPFDDLMDVMYKANGGVTLSPKAQKEIYDLLKEASQYDPESYEFRVLQAKAARKVMAEVPAGLGDYIRTFLYDNMLGNFKTAFSRNFFGNVAYQSLEKIRELPTAAVDAATSKITGKHSALGWNRGKAGSYLEGFKKGAKETGGDIANKVNTTRSGQAGWDEALKNNATVHNDNKKLGHWANQVDFYVENAMKAGDRPIYEANYAEFKTELEQLLQRYGKDHVAGLEGIDDADLPEVIDKISAVRAADAVFQKKGHMSEGLTKLRDGLGDLSRGAFGVDILSTASSPFTLTPGNMLEKALEYTPAGAVKNAVETLKEVRGGNFNQRRFVEEAGRTITGLPVLGAAYASAKKGIINGGYSTDPDEKQAQIDDGFIEYGLNLGGKTYDTSDLPVYGPFAQAGAVVAKEGLGPKSALQAAEAVAGGSAMQGIRRAFGADNASYSSQNGVVENLADTVKSSGTQFIPSLLRQTAQTSDQFKRDLGEYGTNEYYFNSIKNSLPWMRQTLPIKTDIEGQPVLQNQGRGLGSKILENYVLPMNVSEYKPSALNEEASRLLDAGAGNGAFVPKAKRSDLRGWDDAAKINYSEEQFREYKEDLGQLNSKVGHAIIESDFYNGLDDSKKEKVLSDAYSAMKKIARQHATGSETDDKIAQAYLDGDIEGLINYLAGKDATKEAGYQSNSKVGQAIQELADSGDVEGAYDLSSQAELLPNYGLDKKGPDATFSKAYGVYGGLTAEEFAKTYKAVDADKNQALKKVEVINYMDKKNMSQAEGNKFWEAYAKTEGSSPWKLPTFYIDENGKQRWKQ